MALHQHNAPPENWKWEYPAGTHACHYYVGDQESDKPATGTFNEGDNIFIIASTSFYVAKDTASWLLINGASSGGSGSVYAPTGGSYVTYASETALTSERILTAGSSVTIVTDATSVYINALTNGAGGSTVYFPDDEGKSEAV